MSFLGLFSSDSKSSSTTENSSISNVLTANGSNSRINSTSFGDIRVVGGAGKNSRTNVTNNITTTDFGAIEVGENIALRALDQNAGAFDDAVGLVNNALDFGESGLSKGFDLISKNTIAAVSEGLNKVLFLGAAGIIGFVAIQYFRNK